MLRRRVFPSLFPVAPVISNERERPMVSCRCYRRIGKRLITINCINIFHEEFLIEIPLELTHPKVEFDLFLGFQGFLNFRFQSPEQKGFEDFVELFNNIFLFRIFGWALECKPRIKISCRAENIREQKIEQSPKLMEIVLKRGSCDQETVFANMVSFSPFFLRKSRWMTGSNVPIKKPHYLGEGRVFVFNSMGLVNHNIIPSKFLKYRFF